MIYPTDPALNAAQAAHPALWDDLAWAYLPGYNRTQTIVGDDTLTPSGSPSQVVEGDEVGEYLPPGSHYVGLSTVKPIEGTMASTMLAYFKHTGLTPGTYGGILSTAPTTASWSNTQAIVTRNGVYARGVFIRAGTERYSESALPSAPVVAIAMRDVGNLTFRLSSAAADVTTSSSNFNATLTNTQHVAVGGYYDMSLARSSNCVFFAGCIWRRALTPAERQLLLDDPYAVFRKGSGVSRKRHPLFLTPL